MAFWRIPLLLTLFCTSVLAQTVPRDTPILPETSYISQQRYTNAFFGFTISLPERRQLQLMDLSSAQKDFQHFLVGFRSSEKGLTNFVISAKQASGNAYDEAKNAAKGAEKKKALEALAIRGKLFWKTESEEKTVAGKIRRVHYTAALGEYVLDLLLVSYDQRLTDELKHSIESIRFFDPARAREIAGTDSRPYLPAAARLRLASSENRIAALDPGVASGPVYINRYLGFAYQIPPDWSTTDRATQERIKEAGHKFVSHNDSQSDREHQMADRCNRVLLRANKYPDSGQSGNGEFNPLIAILASDPNCFPTPVRFPSSIHDEEEIKDLGHAVIQSFRGTPFMGREVTKIRALDVGGRVFIEIPTTAAVPMPDTKLLRKVYRSMVITSLKDYWVCWMFESDSPSGLEKLLQTPIRFLPNSPRPSGTEQQIVQH